jgi:hypothetical protein
VSILFATRTCCSRSSIISGSLTLQSEVARSQRPPVSTSKRLFCFGVWRAQSVRTAAGEGHVLASLLPARTSRPCLTNACPAVMFVSSLNPTWVDNAEGEVSAQSVAAIGRVHARVRRCCRVDPFCFADSDFDRSDRVKNLRSHRSRRARPVHVVSRCVEQR